MIQDLFKDLTQYMDFLKQEYCLQVSVHDTSGFTNNYFRYIAPYHVHCSGFCLYVKSVKILWERCKSTQLKVVDTVSGDVCFGMCFAGVEEFVAPILYNDKKLGFISISGYRANTTKAMSHIDLLCNNFRLDKQMLLDHYYHSLSEDVPPIAFIKKLIMPMVHILQLIYIQVLKKQDGVILPLSNDNYIYGNALAFINTNFSKKISVEDLAQFCHCSESHISHVFTKNNGKNIKAYINQLRIERAKRFLEITHLPIKEIAALVGFEDSNYFTNVFKSIEYISPRKHREEHFNHPSNNN